MHVIVRLFILAFSVTVLASCRTSPPRRHLAAEGALGPYSAAVDTGEFVFVAGKIGNRSGDFAHEASTALDAVARELGRVGLDLGDVVQSTVYLTDIALYQPFNEIYARKLPAPYPARACVAVAALPGGAKVEVQVVARRP